jgi:hypothetical protein
MVHSAKEYILIPPMPIKYTLLHVLSTAPIRSAPTCVFSTAIRPLLSRSSGFRTFYVARHPVCDGFFSIFPKIADNPLERSQNTLSFFE